MKEGPFITNTVHRELKEGSLVRVAIPVLEKTCKIFTYVPEKCFFQPYIFNCLCNEEYLPSAQWHCPCEKGR